MVLQSTLTSQKFNQFVSLLAVLLVVDAGFAMDKAFSPKVKTNPAKTEEQVELLDKFLKLNPEARRGAIQYVEQMRNGYKKNKSREPA